LAQLLNDKCTEKRKSPTLMPKHTERETRSNEDPLTMSWLCWCWRKNSRTGTFYLLTYRHISR